MEALRATGRAGALGFCGSLVLAVLVVVPAQGALFRVGTGPGCTHGDLQGALNAAAANPGVDEIFLLSGSIHQGQFLVLSGSVRIDGGYPDCAAFEATGTSTLRGSSGARALFAFAGAGERIDLVRLVVTGGDVTGDGGGLHLSGSGLFALNLVTLTGNRATGRGGNLFVDASPGLHVFLTATLVAAGDALHGGGISCSGDGELFVGSDTLIVNNQASGDGGGLHLAASCFVEQRAFGPLAGLQSNLAGGLGGGAYLEAGSWLTLWGLPEGQALLTDNQASQGGGVYATGLGTFFHAPGAEIAFNSASLGGGLLLADFAASTVVRNTTTLGGPPCRQPARCSTIHDNSAVVGGGLFLTTGATVTLDATHLSENSASLSGSAAAILGGAFLRLQSSVVAENQGLEVFSVDGTGSALELGNTTVVDNDLATGTGLIGVGSGVTRVGVLTSLFQQGGEMFERHPTGFAPQLDCILAASGTLFANLPPDTAERQLLVGDPGMVDPAAGNYQLTADSDALDFCDSTQWGLGDVDLEGQPRIVDLPGVPDLLGPRDAGADEHRVLFADGFESGDTAAWSVTVP